MLSLICSAKHKSQLAGLQVLSNLALLSNTAARRLLSHRLLTALEVSSMQPCFYDKTDVTLDLYGPAQLGYQVFVSKLGLLCQRHGSCVKDGASVSKLGPLCQRWGFYVKDRAKQDMSGAAESCPVWHCCQAQQAKGC